MVVVLAWVIAVVAVAVVVVWLLIVLSWGCVGADVVLHLFPGVRELSAGDKIDTIHRSCLFACMCV